MVRVHIIAPRWNKRKVAGAMAIVSGVLGLVSFAALMTYLTTQADTFISSGIMPAAGRTLLTVDFLCAAAQALFFIPALLVLDSTPDVGRVPGLKLRPALGLIALAGIAVLRVLSDIYPAASDILFMAPTGLLGLWMLGFCLRPPERTAVALRLLGGIAGLGLLLTGASFFFLGGLEVFTHGPFAYANNETFHLGIRFGAPSFVLYPIWSSIMGIRLLMRPQ